MFLQLTVIVRFIPRIQTLWEYWPWLMLQTSSKKTSNNLLKTVSMCTISRLFWTKSKSRLSIEAKGRHYTVPFHFDFWYLSYWNSPRLGISWYVKKHVMSFTQVTPKLWVFSTVMKGACPNPLCLIIDCIWQFKDQFQSFESGNIHTI